MIEWVSYSSKAIQDFPMGDPHDRTFPVYLPPGYSAEASDPYPVVFFLAGFSGKGSGYLVDDSAYGVPFEKRMDQAIAAGTLRPFIGVFPDCTSKLGHSQYVNSPAFGKYMDYLCNELTAFIDAKYRTHGDSLHRILAGHSSGGFGALITGMQRPDAFHWLSVSAADSYYEANIFHNVNATLMELQRAGGVQPFIDGILSRPGPRNISGREFEAMMTLAMAPCYAPNVKNPPLYGDLFFDLETGAIRTEVWGKYRTWDPINMVDRFAENLKKLGFIQLECGMSDEHALQWGHRQIAKKLATHGVPHELSEYSGGHGGHHWRFESRLARLFKLMS
jgi:enterochelin esterase-like enzyme